MDVNLTLIGQMITFSILVWATVRHIWPPLNQALEARKQKIADGLAAAEEGQRERQRARDEHQKILSDARDKAAGIVAEAHSEAKQIVAQARAEAGDKAAKLIEQGHAEAALLRDQMLQSMHDEVKSTALLFSEKILGREVNTADNDRLFDELMTGESET